ncbi:shootin-1-like [Mercenaria mercenaria]|uniref:shootin-1-like n=1 Tax=Mercenaria mercenaria TaxID=6596 RepID=UPI00234E49BF|nr:shootin-1-like [Mercenaria mercenaria]
MSSAMAETVSIRGVEDSEEFDEAERPTTLYCKPVTLEEYEDQAEEETEKALCDLMGYLDVHKDEFTNLLKKKKRQDLETGGLLSFMKVRVYDMIHGENSPLVRVTETERDRHLQDLKNNMQKAFDYSLETKGRRTSKRLEEKRLRKANDPNATPSRKMVKGLNGVPPAPPPPPPVPPFVEGTTQKMKIQPRKPLTPIQNRLNQTKTPGKQESDDILGSTPQLDCSLTSLHQELISSNPWKRLKCVNENKSPGGTPAVSRNDQQRTVPLEPLHRALYNKFKNVRPPSPTGSPNTTITSPGEFTP